MSLEDNPKLKEYLEFAKDAKNKRSEAKRLIREAKKSEDKALDGFRELREEEIERLRTKKKELLDEFAKLNKEYCGLATVFCERRRKHEYVRISVRAGNEPIYRSFSGENIYPTKSFYTCLICDSVANITGKPYQPGSEEVIEQAAAQSKNLRLQETAKRILFLKKELDRIQEKLEEVQKEFGKICILFGHDAKPEFLYGEEHVVFDCKCCGRRVSYEEYVKTYNEAKYKGGIVKFRYPSSSKIIS